MDEIKIVDFSKIEKKWQKRWASEKVFEVRESKKEKFYVLDMFPYPSGAGLHIGHAFVFSLGDIYARLKRMQGFNVLYPIGYDSLGLPAENAAIKDKTHPEDYTKKSIANFGKQQKAMGWSYDWSRVVNTSDPDYYKWDQWIFLKMLEKGLAYRRKSPVNWCNECETVLANEQVTNGKCWRHEDTDVEIKHLSQWFLKITDYADELISGLDKVNWPERAKTMQKNWIGKSFGAEVNFSVSGEDWPVFTTRVDTIFGVTFVVVSAQHDKLDELVTPEQRGEVDKFLKKLKSVSEKEQEDMEKEGVFSGSYAVNPMTGEKVPIWIGNFVLAGYGSGMVMAVPAHDERDFDFAKKYNLPIKQVIVEHDSKEKRDGKLEKAFTGFGDLINSEDFDGLGSMEAKEHIVNALEVKGKGKKTVQYRLRDWLISRQRYWGTPIPIIYCDDCGAIPVSERDLPVKLPKKVEFGKGNPLLTNESFVKTKCPKCGKTGRRETDTMDTFANSSWYFLRYADSKNDKKIFDPKNANYWAPINQYIGGPEHITMHLIYLRFYSKFLRDLGLLEFDEPALNYFTQGIVKGADGEKMSKSKGNVVEPLEMIEKFGADSLRLFLVSVASPDKDFNWDSKGIEGSRKFLMKVMNFVDNFKTEKMSALTESRLNRTIRDYTKDIEEFRYNMGVIKLRALFDDLEKGCSKAALMDYVMMLAVICPHISEELWGKLGGKGFVSVAKWPVFDEKKIDDKLEEAEKQVEKTVDDVKNILRIMKEKSGKEGKKVYLYVLPFELKSYSGDKLSEKLGLDVKVYSVADKDKYDPEGKGNKVKPGRPGVYVE